MIHPNTGEYYIGRRSSKVKPELDTGYRGSSISWYRNLDENTIKKVLNKEIIRSGIETKEDLINLEIDEISKNIKNPLCKNAHIPPFTFYPKPGYSLSEETRNKMSLSRKGRKMSPESIEKIRLSINSNPDRFNKKHTEESKDKISKAHKGKKLSENHKQRLRKPKSKEHKQKMKGPRPDYRRPKEKIKCPKCDKLGAPNVMYRFHFDNCGIPEISRKVQCPYCKKSGGISNMKRWHFDNCKFKSK